MVRNASSGPNITAGAPQMSAVGGKADMTFCGNPLSRSLLGLKRTCPCALHVSANDPKRTSMSRFVRQTAALMGYLA